MRTDLMCVEGACLNDREVCVVCMIGQFNMRKREYDSLNVSLPLAPRSSDDFKKYVSAKKRRAEEQMKEYLTAAMMLGFDVGKHPTAHHWAAVWGLDK